MLARAIRAPLTARTPAVLLSRCSSSKPAASSSSSEEPLSAKEQERIERNKMIAEVMRQKTMQEVSKAGASRRPEGITHVTGFSEEAKEDDAPTYAAKYDDDSDEWGGPKGELRHAVTAISIYFIVLCARSLLLTGICTLFPRAGDEPTRYGDWERQGRTIDF